ncbi:MAG: multidrug transporter MatE [Dehalococcoidia bacterium SG8_51_3]|nr:MAG: multidrug transporter MatE [Dehalococcoidia bacterium SG8_51_3]
MQETDPIRERYLTKPLTGLILRNSMPAVLSMLVMCLYQIVDGMFLGRKLGPEALASVNLLYPILVILIGLAVMIGVGGNARIGVLLGAADRHNAGRTLSLILCLGTGLGVIGSLITFLALPTIPSLLGAYGILADFATEYLTAILPFFTPLILSFILEQATRNDGRPVFATTVMVSTALLNILLDYLFIFPLDMGIRGAAIATGIANALAAAVFLARFGLKTLRQSQGLILYSPGGGIRVLGKIAYNGSSEMMNELAGGVTTFLYNRTILAMLGAMALASFTIVQYLVIIGMMLLIGLGTGSQPVIGYNHGAGITHRVRGTLKRLLAIGLVLGAVLFVLLQTQAGPITRLFIPHHPETLSITIEISRFVSIALLFMPIGIISSMFFTSLLKAGNSLILSIARGFIFTVLGILILPRFLGATGIWLTPVLAEGLTGMLAITLLARWYRNEGTR